MDFSDDDDDVDDDEDLFVVFFGVFLFIFTLSSVVISFAVFPPLLNTSSWLWDLLCFACLPAVCGSISCSPVPGFASVCCSISGSAVSWFPDSCGSVSCSVVALSFLAVSSCSWGWRRGVSSLVVSSDVVIFGACSASVSLCLDSVLIVPCPELSLWCLVLLLVWRRRRGVSFFVVSSFVVVFGAISASISLCLDSVLIVPCPELPLWCLVPLLVSCGWRERFGVKMSLMSSASVSLSLPVLRVSELKYAVMCS